MQTGALTPLEVHRDGASGVEGLGAVASVTVASDGANVYTAAVFSDAVAVFNRDENTGALTFVEVLRDGVDGLAATRQLTVSPDSTHIYVLGSTDSALAVFGREVIASETDAEDINGDFVTNAIDVQLVINAVLGIPIDFDGDVDRNSATDAVLGV